MVEYPPRSRVRTWDVHKDGRRHIRWGNKGKRRGGKERKGKGRGSTLQMLSLLTLSQFNNPNVYGQILIIPEAVFDFLYPCKMSSFRCYYYTNRITIKCTSEKKICFVCLRDWCIGRNRKSCMQNKGIFRMTVFLSQYNWPIVTAVQVHVLILVPNKMMELKTRHTLTLPCLMTLLTASDTICEWNSRL